MSNPDRNYAHLYPAFAAKVERIAKKMDDWCAVHLSGFACAMAEGYRTAVRQQELFAQGRSTPGDIVTEKDGVVRSSNHQSCLAADLAFVKGGQLTWDVPEAAWQYLQHLAHTEGLVSGSDWKSFKDRPHVEWPVSDTGTYALARKWKAVAGLT